jgi:DNA polymerase-3 subunit gamma/tau
MFDKAVSFCGNSLNYKDVAATLNVLDYDTYFSVTELLLSGNYVETLLRFDEVLSRGFSPQVFISGLNAHMRDLLMAKGPAISLVEFTGTLVERYKAQAQKCDETFLFGAISLLTEADGKIRQSSNQRLLVELGLMKIAGLGQKKNEDVGFESFETHFSLPDLAQPTAQAPAPATHVARSAEVTPSPAMPKVEPVTPIATPAATAEGTTEMKPAASVSAPASSEAKEQEPKRPLATVRTQTKRVSLSSLLSNDNIASTSKDEEKSADVESAEVEVDPQCEEKLTLAREKIIETLLASRPRIGSRFEESMEIEGNVVRIEVQSKELYTEIMQQKSDIQKLMSAKSGAKGYIELEVVVNEQMKVSRPITLEDRLQHLLSRNDRLSEMLEVLGLDAE